MSFVKNEIDNRKINGTGIEAFCAGVRGNDIADVNVASFWQSLESLATTNRPPHLERMDDYASLQRIFQGIANNIVNRWTETNFALITPGFPAGTRVRMTFNNESTPQQAANAQRFLEGTVEIRGRDYILTNIRYGGGVSSSAGQEVRGVMDSIGVRYEFPHISGFDPRTETPRLRQFFMNEGATSWQANIEYRSDGSSRQHTQRNNALIYLVLDESNSIGRNDVDRVRQAAVEFITTLYRTYN